MTILLTDAIWKIMVDVNDRINKMPYKTDVELYHTPEFWTIMSGHGGDCEDFALTKRKELIAAGLDPLHLLPAIGFDKDGAGHCVLLIETDKGAFAMDNNVPEVVAWTDPRVTIKKWVKRANSDGTWKTM